MTEESEVESKFACVMPIDDVNPYYLYSVIEISLPKFLHRYRSDINLQMEAFDFFYIPILDRQKQDEIAENLQVIQKRIERQKRKVLAIKKIKENSLSKMFI